MFQIPDKKKLLVIIGLVLVIVLSLILIKMFFKKTYSDNPKDWLETKGDSIEVNPNKATKGESYLNYIGQQYISPEIETVFIHDGVYLGKYFKEEYADKNEVFIRFTKELNPENNIPEGYILERFEDKKPVVYIFLDKDWKSKIGDSNIFWGKDYQSNKEFVFTELENGIYYDKIVDDRERFSEDFKIHYGGIMVGKINQNDISEKRFDNAIIFRLI